MQQKYQGRRIIRLDGQDSKGKGDAVRKEFAIAQKEILMILDTDLTVPSGELPRFYDSVATVTIQSTRLEYFIPGSRVDSLKLDVQGHEMRVLRGAARVLTDNPRVRLLLGKWPYGLTQAGDSVEQLFGFLDQRDFSIFRFHGGELMPYEANNKDENIPDSYTNGFAFRGGASSAG